jgi:hypothetical protein
VACSYPDHAQRLSEVYARWWEKTKRDQAQSAFYDARMAELLGMDWRECDRPPSQCMHCRAAMGLAHSEEETKFGPDQVDEDGCDVEWMAIQEDLVSLNSEIAALPILNTGDIALRVQAFMLRNVELWIDGETDEYDIVKFVEGIAHFANVTPLRVS